MPDQLTQNESTDQRVTNPKGGLDTSSFIVFFVTFGLIACLLTLPFIGVGLFWLSKLGLGPRYGGKYLDCTSGKVLEGKPDEWKAWVDEAADQYLGGDQAILIAVIQQESGWDPTKKNGNAWGLGQFMPITYPGIKYKDGTRVFPTSESRLDPKSAIFGVAIYFGQAVEAARKSVPDGSDIMAIYRHAYLWGYHQGGYFGTGSPQYREGIKGANNIINHYISMTNDGDCEQQTTPDEEQDATGVVDCSSGPGLPVPCANQNTMWDSFSSLRGDVACGVTSVFMILKYYESRTNHIASKFTQPSYVFSNYIGYVKGGMNPTAYFRAAAGAKVIYGDASLNNWRTVKDSLDKNNPVVLYTNKIPGHRGMHIIALVGYQQNGSQTIFIYNDPTGGKRKTIDANTLSQHLNYPTGKKYMYAEIF